MKSAIYLFTLDLDWQLIGRLSTIDRFDASWSSIERQEGKSLQQLKKIATVRSAAASTRIEGSLMTNAEVDALLANIDIGKLEDRDSQEVVGYYETMDLIADAYNDIGVTQNSLKHLHRACLKHSEKDQWHRGDYKQHSNAVEATYPDGTSHIIFRTTEAGFPTSDAMRALVDWYRRDTETHPLVKSAVFVYEFLSIHPFQDGNGRLSRLLTNLLLLKNGYKWVQYVSLEHEVEDRKSEYYRVLRSCQGNRPNEDISEWITFFFNVLERVQQQLMQKLEESGLRQQLSTREKTILAYISTHPGCKSGAIAKALAIPSPTVKRQLAGLLEKQLVDRHGVGAGTTYTVV